MTVTVILCTYNRCKSLAKALGSVAVSELDKSVEWEVLVVDNNSTDQTRAVVEDFSRRYPGRFRYMFESEQGRSFALNSGIRGSSGDILAFMDDDVLVSPTWLKNLTAPLSKGEWSGSGGRILAANSFSCPNWLSLHGRYNMGGMLALFDLGDRAGKTDQPPFGTNMAIRKEMFQKYGLFRKDLGRCGNNMMSNEDTEVGRRLMAAGERLWYEPSAVVYHAVPQNRLTKKYFLRFWFNYGRSGVREHGKRPDICRIPRYYFTIPKIVGTVLAIRTLRWILALNPQQRFFLKGMVWMTAGQIVEYYRLSLDTA